MRNILALLSGLLIAAPLCAYERTSENTIKLSPEEVEICAQDDHGCSLAPNSMFLNDLKGAYQMGFHACRNWT